MENRDSVIKTLKAFILQWEANLARLKKSDYPVCDLMDCDGCSLVDKLEGICSDDWLKVSNFFYVIFSANANGLTNAKRQKLIKLGTMIKNKLEEQLEEIKKEKRCYDCLYCRKNGNSLFSCKKGNIVISAEKKTDCKDYESAED